MKKSIIVSILIILSFVIVTFSSGLGGSSSDPLVTENEANDILGKEIDRFIDKKLENIEPDLETAIAMSISDDVSKQNKVSYVLNDSFKLFTGDKITLRSGTVKIVGTGSLIDVTSGVEVKNPSKLDYNKTYIVAENSSFTITVTSLSSKINTNVTYSNPYTIQYEGYADALSYLGLFQGTTYGYELDRPATRTESIIMLIRILGEETAALAYEGSHPFTDVPSWADSYVAYAYEKGYTKGMSATLFGANNMVRDFEYYTFLLRSLKYEDNVDFKWDKSYEKAIELNIIDQKFHDSSKANFFRDQIAYASFNTLGIKIKGIEQTLVGFLSANGTVNLEDYEHSKTLIK